MGKITAKEAMKELTMILMYYLDLKMIVHLIKIRTIMHGKVMILMLLINYGMKIIFDKESIHQDQKAYILPKTVRSMPKN